MGTFIVFVLILGLMIIVLVNNGKKNKKRYKEERQYKAFEVERQYKKALLIIEDTRQCLFSSINSTREELDLISIGPITVDESDLSPIDEMNNLQNILINTVYPSEQEVIDSLSYYPPYTKKSIFAKFDRKINKLGAFKADLPDFTIIEDEYMYYRSLINTEYPSLEIELERLDKEVNEQLSILDSQLEVKKEEWSKGADEHRQNKSAYEVEADIIKEKFYNNISDVIEDYYYRVINRVNYNNKFSKSINVEFRPDNNLLAIDYLLPSIDEFPSVKEIRYIKTRNEHKYIYYSDTQLKKIYEDVTYRITLDLINRMFYVDFAGQIKSIAFNGWVNSLDESTGLRSDVCILSVTTSKEDFFKINLPEVNPKLCFKGLKGVSAHNISNLTPIQPIVSINKNDNRFVESYDVEIDSNTNLAAMDWLDFEHLIREVFEKEFSSDGGEVKVTQSSRDGGVDAIAFDPDPIRGGKIVIQAKRYTNVVGVSAVRDLYGTVLNEGATKGILVTTSDFGSDSYDFAKDKPITLMNGNNLLHLLKQHNYNAIINIKEAKKALKKDV